MNCRLCQSQKVKLLLVAGNVHGRHILGKERFRLYECQQCRAVFTDIKVSPSYYQKYYPSGYYEDYQGNFIIKKLLIVLRKISFRRRLRLIERNRPAAKKILEVGCGSGDFLAQLPSCWEKYGTEINPEACREAKAAHPEIKIFSKKIDERGLGEKIKFDVVVMWHVLEHIDNPKGLLKGLSRLLNKNGVLLFDIPNRGSVGFSLTHHHWFHLDTPRHLFFYDDVCLGSLLKKNHFRIQAYLGDPVDYFQDLAVSLANQIKASKGKSLGWRIMALLLVPPAILVRLFLACFWPRRAEVNTYVVKPGW